MPDNNNLNEQNENTNAYQYNPNRPSSSNSPANQEDDHADTKKVVDTVAKGAAEYFAPGVGAQAYDAAKSIPVVGDQIDQAVGEVSQSVDKIPGAKKLSKGLNESGVTDAASGAIDLIGSKGATGAANQAQNVAKGGTQVSGGDGAGASTPIMGNRKNTQFNEMIRQREDEMVSDADKAAEEEDGESKQSSFPSSLPTDSLDELNDHSSNGNESGQSDMIGKAVKFLWDKYKIHIILGGSGVFLFILFLLLIFGGGTDSSSGTVSLLSTYISCDTITIINEDGSEETLDFEEYVAGVVTAESAHSDFPEASKAQAVIARTYAIKNTNYCTTPIENSTNRQVYTDPSDFGREVAQATKGIILVDENDSTNLLSTYFASYPSEGYNNFPAFPACSAVNCTEDFCTTTMYQIGPDNAYQEMTFTMDRYYNGGTWNGADLENQTGHCYGLSQLGARYLDYSGYNYEEILETFYFDFTLASMLSSNGLSSMLTSISWYEIRTSRYGITNLAYWLDNNIFYSSRTSLLGQCTWYAHGRAKEILASALDNGAISEDEYNTSISILNRFNRNANMWWDINRGLGESGFSFSADTPKIGSLIVFDGVSTASVNGTSCGQYYSAGHVGIVENVSYDENGDWIGLWISDGWKDDSCEQTACFRSEYWSREEVMNYRNGCRPLLGFIYLFDYEV